MTYFFLIFFGTFIFEDVSLATSIALIAQNKISFSAAFLACFLGIGLGDLGIYLIGYGISYFKLGTRFGFFEKIHVMLDKKKRKTNESKLLSYSIFISRFIPGTRVLTHLSAGFMGYHFLNYFLLTWLSTFIWVLFAFLGAKSLLTIFSNHWVVSLITFFLFISTTQFLIGKMSDPWKWKAFKHSWRKWLYFEFWPASFFYLPIIPYYIYLSFRYKSLYMPFYTNPQLVHGGLIGESKWEFLRHLSTDCPSTLYSMKVDKDLSVDKARELINNEKFCYPFIIKPDIGQRGFGVRIMRSHKDLEEYIEQSKFDRIIQRLSVFSNEAGLFYVRKPSEKMGRIFSITDKKFPYIIGDGVNTTGDLILSDFRARIIAPVYFSRLKGQLNEIPIEGKKIPLAECGNHCQGAIFQNGEFLISDALTTTLDRIAKQIPDFYFGRFDVRYKSQELLRQGLDFEIVEVNGAGAEATHIWDKNTKLLDAYKTLFTQWDLLFQIGSEVSKIPGKKRKVLIFCFLKECWRVAFRNESLSVSS